MAKYMLIVRNSGSVDYEDSDLEAVIVAQFVGEVVPASVIAPSAEIASLPTER